MTANIETTNSQLWVGTIIMKAASAGCKTVLDYGAQELMTAIEIHRIAKDLEVIPVAGLHMRGPGLPTPSADLVFSSCFLEQIPEDKLAASLAEMASLCRKRLVLAVRGMVPTPDLWPDMLSPWFTLDDVEESKSRNFLIITATPKAAADWPKRPRLRGAESAVAAAIVSNCEFFPGRLCPPHVRGMQEHAGRAVLVGPGRSLQGMDGAIQTAAEGGAHVYAMGEALRWLLGLGIAPAAYIEPSRSWDVSSGVLEALDMHPDIPVWLASFAPVFWQDAILREQVYLWHAYYGAPSMQAIADADAERTGAIIGGQSPEMRALRLLSFLGYREVAVYGVDCESEGGSVEIKAKGMAFRTTPLLKFYAQSFKNFEARLSAVIKRQGSRPMNIMLRGDGLLRTLNGD